MNAVAGLIIACLALTAYGLPNPQIVGGSDALDGAYPYQVSLRDNPFVPYRSHFCSGAIISERYIITSAHCIIPYLPYSVYAAVGSNNLDDIDVVLHPVRKLITHAGYNSELHIHDIGLIQVRNNIVFTEYVQPIALPTDDRNYGNYPLVATGWGRLWLGGPIPNHLQEIIVRGYESDYANELCSKYEHTMCTYLGYSGQGMCHGDDGGPLVADNVLVGLVSYSYHPCTGGPDVYTKVFFYRSWIKYYTGMNISETDL
ncbi:PREDICTED: chymotrypsin-2-like isoform X2 [Wasmannia auropunctata]|uniref:chymotrypsin-2-like isoform X2 n=1 Tax=Wasmannia auropunctata TaxID=64793 RepID=UPI0005F00CA0|nr:PREDICTED: chymotrypsin-2-like isoform X2 [Wasmannia auropunctata]